MMAMRPVHVFGDSIGKGVLFDEDRGRYSLARDRCDLRLQAALGVTVENHARMGATVEEGLLDLAASENLAGSVVAIEYGGNDCDLRWDEVAKAPDQPHQAKVPLEAFRRLLSNFVEKVRQMGAEPLMVTPPPLHARRFFNWVTKGLDGEAVLRYLGDMESIYRWQERYAIAVRDVAAITGCRLLDIRDAFLARRDLYDHLSVDGMHPNARGHALIAQAALEQGLRYAKGVLPLAEGAVISPLSPVHSA